MERGPFFCGGNPSLLFYQIDEKTGIPVLLDPNEILNTAIEWADFFKNLADLNPLSRQRAIAYAYQILEVAERMLKTETERE